MSLKFEEEDQLVRWLGFLPCLLVFFCTGCAQTPPNLAGTWEGFRRVDGSSNSIVFRIEFKEDGAFLLKYNNLAIPRKGTFRLVDGKTLEMTVEKTAVEGKEGEKIPVVYAIEKLTGSEMVLKHQFGAEEYNFLLLASPKFESVMKRINK